MVNSKHLAYTQSMESSCQFICAVFLGRGNKVDGLDIIAKEEIKSEPRITRSQQLIGTWNSSACSLKINVEKARQAKISNTKQQALIGNVELKPPVIL